MPTTIKNGIDVSETWEDPLHEGRPPEKFLVIKWDFPDKMGLNEKFILKISDAGDDLVRVCTC